MKHATGIAALAIIGLAIVAYATFFMQRDSDYVPDTTPLPEPVFVIEMGEKSYSTTTLRVHAGDVVAFRTTATQPRWPASDLHPTHEIYSDFDPRRPVEPGEQWAFNFERCGTWRFHDHLKPSIRGVIEVVCEQ